MKHKLPSRRSISHSVPRKLQPTPRRSASDLVLQARNRDLVLPLHARPSSSSSRRSPLPLGLRRLRPAAPPPAPTNSLPPPPSRSSARPPTQGRSKPPPPPRPPSFATSHASTSALSPPPPPASTPIPPPLFPPPPAKTHIPKPSRRSVVSPYSEPGEAERRKNVQTFQVRYSAKEKEDIRKGEMQEIQYSYVGAPQRIDLKSGEAIPEPSIDTEKNKLLRHAAAHELRPPDFDNKILPFKPETRPHLTLRNFPPTALPGDVDMFLRGLLGEAGDLPEYRFIRSPFAPSLEETPHIVRVYPRTLAEFDHLLASLPRPPPHVPSPFRNVPPPHIPTNRKVGSSVVWATNTAIERAPIVLNARMEEKEGWKGEQQRTRCVSERGHHVVLNVAGVGKEELEKGGLDEFKKDVRFWLRTRGIVRQIADEDIGFPQIVLNEKRCESVRIAVTLSTISLTPSHSRTDELYQIRPSRRRPSTLDRTFADLPKTWVYFTELADVDELHHFFPTVNPMSFANSLTDILPSSSTFFSPNVTANSCSSTSAAVVDSPTLQASYRSPTPPQTLDGWWTPAVQRLKAYSFPYNNDSPSYLWSNLPEHLFFTFLRPASLSAYTIPPPRVHLRNLSQSIFGLGKGHLPLFRAIANMQAKLGPPLRQAEAEADRKAVEKASRKPTKVVIQNFPAQTSGEDFETWLKSVGVGSWVECLFYADSWGKRTVAPESKQSEGGKPLAWAGDDLQVGGFVKMDTQDVPRTDFAVVAPTSRDAARIVSTLDNTLYQTEWSSNRPKCRLRAWIQH